MINPDKISLEWIKQVSHKNRNADNILVEKVIRALLLLEGLVKKKLNFVFKGGTALMLHFNSTKRLSIDIDIILPETPDDLELIFGEIAIAQGFMRYELQHRVTDSKIKKEHYKFFYKPLSKSRSNEEYILLDILYESINYEKVIQLPIQSNFVPTQDESIFVAVPCLADILADKLTAFAPNTTGIPYFRNNDSMSMEIIKQLYDIGNLFDHVNDISILKSTFNRFATTELLYRGQNNLKLQDVLEDIFQTAFCIVSRGTEGMGDFKELQTGIQRIKGYIFSENYHLEKAITHAAKAAYLSVLIKNNAVAIEHFKDPESIKDWLIAAPMSTKLNKLKKSNPEAFFYLYKVFEFTNLNNTLI